MTYRGLYQSRLSFTLEGPFLMEGLGARAFGVDKAQIRDHAGCAIIPAGQARGVVRQAREELATVYPGPDIDWTFLFGETRDASRIDEGRSAISFTDLRAVSGGDRQRHITRVAIDPDLGSARDGHLLTAECPALYGETVEFSGNVQFVAENDDAAGEIAAYLNKAIQLIPAIGAMKSVGFGFVENASLEPPYLLIDFRAQPDKSYPSTGRIRISFSLDRPLLVATDLPESNVVQSATAIPGSVLKGALARKLALAGYNLNDPGFAEALSSLHLSEAVGYRNGRCVSAGADKDMLEVSKDGATGQAWNESSLASPNARLPAAPGFFHDWKNVRLSKEIPAFDVRTRVQIGEHGTAEESALFTNIALRTDDLVFSCEAELNVGTSSERSAVWDGLLTGLFGIGKTHATASVLEVSKAAPAQISSNTSRFLVTLMTPFHLCRIDALDDPADFPQIVEDYWSSATKETGRISRMAVGETEEAMIFATQEIVGGFAAAARRPFSDDEYEPLVLLGTGSRFVLEQTPGREPLSKILEALCKTGLPLPNNLKLKNTHLRTVHVAANGYGQISVDEVN